MAENLVVVESPAKAKTINKYLGKAYVVKASMGHVKDLPKSRLGVDVAADFEPTYVTVRARTKVLKQLKLEAKKASRVFLATDPDREGEAIGWHLAAELKTPHNEVRRVRFHEITKAAVLAAIRAPTDLDEHLVNAQQARRVLDRLVGYGISPLLWKAVRRGLSAGRVQSVAVRLLCEREAEIEAFKSTEYWDLAVDLGAAAGTFRAVLVALGGEKAERLEPTAAAALGAEVSGLTYGVASVERKEQRRFPSAPFTTSALQQEASKKLRFTAKRTMALAQQLYEGVDLGPDGTQGLITYMRTDSVRVSPEAQAEARSVVAGRFGPDHLPSKPPFYKAKRPGQDAHEAVRPASCARLPNLVARFLSPDQNKLYGLIWRRFLASQMAPAIFDATVVEVLAARPRPSHGTPLGDARFRANGSVERFAGFLAAHRDSRPNSKLKEGKPGLGGDREDGDSGQAKDGDGEGALPPLAVGEALRFLGGAPEQHFTLAPPRFNDASLVKMLEERGIGRPSTYAAIISTILDRLYVERIEGGRLQPTELGQLTNKVLVRYFKDVLDVDFTAHLEEQLDQVAEGILPWRKAVGDFYVPFIAELETAKASVGELKATLLTETVAGVFCEKCGAAMEVKWGRLGKFLACPKYPACKFTRPLARGLDGSLKAGERLRTDEVCPKCGKPMDVKQGRFGAFLACGGYPACKSTKPMASGPALPCPKCGVGSVRPRRSKRGRVFYGCDQYPKCDFVSWGKPVAKDCPACGAKFLVEKPGRSGTALQCETKGCGHREAVPAEGVTT